MQENKRKIQGRSKPDGAEQRGDETRSVVFFRMSAWQRGVLYKTVVFFRVGREKIY
jgi:hypothetical protein